MPMNAELEQYIDTHIDAEPANLARLERETNLRQVNGRMCSGHIQGRLLKMLTAMAAPKRVLELGTFTGYSALCIAEALDDDGHLDTVEIDDELEDVIADSLASSPHGRKITPHTADALEFARSRPDGSYDLVFIDADKRRYADYYEECLRLLRPGGFMIIDNTLWYGHVVEPDHARDPQTRGIMEFNDIVAADPRVETAMVPVRDGLTLVRKLKQPRQR